MNEGVPIGSILMPSSHQKSTWFESVARADPSNTRTTNNPTMRAIATITTPLAPPHRERTGIAPSSFFNLPQTLKDADHKVGLFPATPISAGTSAAAVASTSSRQPLPRKYCHEIATREMVVSAYDKRASSIQRLLLRTLQTCCEQNWHRGSDVTTGRIATYHPTGLQALQTSPIAPTQYRHTVTSCPRRMRSPDPGASLPLAGATVPGSRRLGSLGQLRQEARTSPTGTPRQRNTRPAAWGFTNQAPLSALVPIATNTHRKVKSRGRPVVI